MDHLRYRLESLPAALNTRKTRDATDPSLTTRHRGRRVLLVALAVCALVLYENHSSTKHDESPATKSDSMLVTLLAEARVDAARAKLDQNRPDEALTTLVFALKGNPECAAARDLAREILATTAWNFPETTLRHGLAIDHLEFAAPATLWVSLCGDINTTVRWNLESLKIENVLFPLKLPETRSLVLDSGHRWVVIERGGFALLCNAVTLTPVRDLGVIPPALTPSSVITFSRNGLLVAHPALEEESESSISWLLRDTATGEIIRKSDPAGPEQPASLAAFLDNDALHVFRADGSLWTMPVSPVAPIEVTPPREEATFLHARFSAAGGSALALKDLGPHMPPTLRSISFPFGAQSPLALTRFLETDAWTLQPSLWTGLLKRADAPLQVQGNTATVADGRAPLRTVDPITAAAFSGGRSFVASGEGDLTIFRSLPAPSRSEHPAPSGALDPVDLLSAENLTEFLTGVVRDPAGRGFVNSSGEQRLQALKDCDFAAVARIFPELDFTPLIAGIRSLAPRATTPESLLALTQRRARAAFPPADSAAQDQLEQIFKEGDPAAILSAIQSAGGQGPTAAKALELALASTHPEWIEACLGNATHLPLLLRRLAVFRIAWLQNRRADSLAAWPNGFPNLQRTRLSEDWDGWEQADFGKAMEALHHCMTEELAALEVPENPTPEQRKAIFERLSDPATLNAVGRARFAKACADAAVAFSPFEEEAGATLKLASLARSLGDVSSPCLRAEALAHTTLGNYQKARNLWVSLLTEHPAESLLPSDYAEAAYTAFECGDPKQAAAILTTGVGSFPDDADFALRAGWIALLTNNSEQAYRFLLAGNQIGYPEEKRENATALLAIAAVRNGAAEDAAVFYQDLIRLDPAWEKPETIETLDWPEELKASLRQLSW